MCTFKGCRNKAFNGLSKCALHCDKNNYQNDHYSGLLGEFYSLFCNYIFNDLSAKINTGISSLRKEDFDNFCNQAANSNELITNTIKETSITLREIKFPERNVRDFFDYVRILRLFKEAFFDSCEFYCTNLALNEVQVFFRDCRFRKHWSLYDYKQFLIADNVIYQKCQFDQDVSVYIHSQGRAKLTKNQFNFNCIFNKKLSINNVDIDSQLFYSSQVEEKHSLKIKELEVSNARLNNKFIINNLKSDSVTFEDVEFNGKFEFKNSCVTQVSIDNTNFAKVSDFFSSIFTAFKIHKSIFNQFVGFERCEFGAEAELLTKHITQFKFTTFLDFSNFRNSTFLSGLRLDEANFKLPPNFYNTSIEDKLTNRETYRIIKHSFDMVGNKLEANKFYSLELRKYRNELFSKKTLVKKRLHGLQLCQERVVFNINFYGSNFGQNFFRPIFIILGLMGVFSLLVYGQQQNWLYKITPYNAEIACVVNAFNYFAKALIPFTPLQKDGMEFLSLLFGIAFSVLVWLTITAIKMHTRR